MRCLMKKSHLYIPTMIDFQQELDRIKLNRNGSVVSLHKPLLLLLAISEVINGHINQFLYDDLEPALTSLLSKYGLKNTKTLNPQYPFIYLAGNPVIWHCTVEKGALKHPDAASRKDLLGAFGSFSADFYQYISSKDNAIKCIQYSLNSYWPEAYHAEILDELGVFDLVSTYPLSLARP